MKKYLVVLLSGLVILNVQSVQAEEMYVGGSILSTEIDTDIDLVVISGSSSLDEEDSGFKVFVGRQINENLSIEGFYADFGAVNLNIYEGDRISLEGTEGTTTASLNTKMSTTGLGFNAKYTFPVTSMLNLYGKFGFMRWDVEATGTYSSVSSSFSETINESDSGTDAIYGIGASLDINEDISLFIDYELTDVSDADTTILGAGVAVNF